MQKDGQNTKTVGQVREGCSCVN